MNECKRIVDKLLRLRSGLIMWATINILSSDCHSTVGGGVGGGQQPN